MAWCCAKIRAWSKCAAGWGLRSSPNRTPRARSSRAEAARQGPTHPPPRPRGKGWVEAPTPLAQRRELRPHDEHVLVLAELAPGGRGPGAGGARLIADREPLGGVLVGPHMDPVIEPAELGVTTESEGRQFGAPLDPLGPFLNDGRGRAGKHRIGADLIQIAKPALLELRREWRWDDDLAFHLLQEFLDLRRPARQLHRFAAQPGALAEILIRPAMDDAVQWPHRGGKESAERGDLDAVAQRFAEPLLAFRGRARLQPVGAHLDDHVVSSKRK